MNNQFEQELKLHYDLLVKHYEKYAKDSDDDSSGD